MSRLFGTDGIRGQANSPPMDPETALAVGRAVAHLGARRACGRPRIAVGRDPRLSGDMIEAALTAGACSLGADVLALGVLPTPGIAFLTRDLKADAGVVVSASHNPFADNGIKVFDRDGCKLPDADEAEIERLLAGTDALPPPPRGDGIGRVVPIADAADRYASFCRHTFPAGFELDGLKLVLDCANGAASTVAPALFRDLGAEVTALNCEPDGININAGCGALYPEAMARRVTERGAAAGLALDGDGDRLVAVDETGRVLTGDHLLGIFARFYREAGRLRNNRVVATVMSNIGLRLALAKLGLEQAVSPVGDRHVLRVMRERDAVLGGESSGHIIFLDLHTTGDGIMAALQLLGAMRAAGRSLAALASIVTLCPQIMLNVPVTRKPPLEEIPELAAAVAEAETELGDSGRVLIRYSGTQNLCRVMVEGPSAETAERLGSRLAAAVAACLGQARTAPAGY